VFRWVCWLLLAAIILPVSAGAVLAYSHGWPDSWQTANWSSSGLLPAPGSIEAPHVIVLASRTGNWKSIFAEHLSIVLKPAGAQEWIRYDVVGWGDPVRRNAFAADAFWYGNQPYIVRDIAGADAASLIPRIEESISRYPYARSGAYRVWPGPNSNSFVAWVVRNTEGFVVELPPAAVGKDFISPGLDIARAASGTGFVVSLSGIAGVTVALREGLEINLFGAIIGVDPEELAIKLPSLGKLSLLNLFSRHTPSTSTTSAMPESFRWVLAD
jgi:hypothetical protein